MYWSFRVVLIKYHMLDVCLTICGPLLNTYFCATCNIWILTWGDGGVGWFFGLNPHVVLLVRVKIFVLVWNEWKVGISLSGLYGVGWDRKPSHATVPLTPKLHPGRLWYDIDSTTLFLKPGGPSFKRYFKLIHTCTDTNVFSLKAYVSLTPAGNFKQISSQGFLCDVHILRLKYLTIP